MPRAKHLFPLALLLLIAGAIALYLYDQSLQKKIKNSRRTWLVSFEAADGKNHGSFVPEEKSNQLLDRANMLSLRSPKLTQAVWIQWDVRIKITWIALTPRPLTFEVFDSSGKLIKTLTVPADQHQQNLITGQDRVIFDAYFQWPIEVAEDDNLEAWHSVRIQGTTESVPITPEDPIFKPEPKRTPFK